MEGEKSERKEKRETLRVSRREISISRSVFFTFPFSFFSSLSQSSLLAFSPARESFFLFYQTKASETFQMSAALLARRASLAPAAAPRVAAAARIVRLAPVAAKKGEVLHLEVRLFRSQSFYPEGKLVD